MTKQFTILILALLFFKVNYAQVVINEDFSTATGTTPPTGWTNLDLSGSGYTWAFDNPGGETLNTPITDPAAIFDSDYYGGSSEGDSSTLNSPVFDASNTSEHFYLSFDHFFEDGFGGEYHIDVFDGTTWNDVLSGTVATANPQHEFFEITTALAGTANGQFRFRWIGDYSWYWIVDNVKLEKSTCPAITNQQVDNISSASVDISWTAGGSETSWNVEWGAPGFTPGTGTEIGSAVATSENQTIGGLNSSTDYDIYVQADCGSGNGSVWVLIHVTTSCAPISSFPWLETFENVTGLGTYNYDMGLMPTCWSASEGYWFPDVEGSYETGADAYSGTQFMALYSWDDDTLWTPEFELVAGTQYEFKFMFAGDNDGYSGWNGQVVLYDNQTDAVTALSDGAFVTSSEVIDNNYRAHTSCFMPTISGTYRFGIKLNSNYDPYYLVIDDVSIIERGTSAGTDGSSDVCQISGLINLNSVANIEDAAGIWSFDFNPNVIVNDTMLNPQYIPSGAIDVLYTTTGCLQDTVVAHITIYDPSSAGQDGNISTCRNQPVDLLSGLNGTVDLGGDWYGPSGSMLSGSAIVAPNLAGQYNYEYIVGNGVCPDDTASVVLTATSCDYLGLDENAGQSLTVYPNPSKGAITISTSENITGTLQIMDAQGKLIQTQVLTNVNTLSVDLTGYTNGVYILKVNSDQINTITRVIKE